MGLKEIAFRTALVAPVAAAGCATIDGRIKDARTECDERNTAFADQRVSALAGEILKAQALRGKDPLDQESAEARVRARGTAPFERCVMPPTQDAAVMADCLIKAVEDSGGQAAPQKPASDRKSNDPLQDLKTCVDGVQAEAEKVGEARGVVERLKEAIAALGKAIDTEIKRMRAVKVK